MFLAQLKTLINLLYLLINEPVIGFLYVLINLLMARDVTEIEDVVHKLFVLEKTQTRLNRSPLFKHLLKIL